MQQFLLRRTTATGTRTTSSRTRWGLLSVLLLVSNCTVIMVVQGQACPSCYRGAAMLSTAPQPVCTAAQTQVSGLFQTDTECQDLQLRNFQQGCCASPPIGSCSYCADPAYDSNPDALVPTGQYVDPYNCFEYAAQNEAYLGMFEDGTCEDTFLRRAGHYCGCGPEQVQQCWLCPDQQPPTKPQKTDAWITNANCRGIEYLFSLFTAEECTAFPYTAGADLAQYCGCNGLNTTEIEEQADLYQCNLCDYTGTGASGASGAYVTNPDTVYTTAYDPYPKTCQQAEDFARDIIKTPAGCRNTNYFGRARKLCTCSDPTTSAAAAAPSWPGPIDGRRTKGGGGGGWCVSVTVLLGVVVSILIEQ